MVIGEKETERLLDAIGEWILVVTVMFFLWIIGVGLNNFVSEWKELGAEAPPHTRRVWVDCRRGSCG